MKEQITTWLFLLLLGSSYNVETARSQTITQYPYTMQKEGWSLGVDLEWMTFPVNDPGCGFTGYIKEIYLPENTYASSPIFNLTTLQNPELTFTGGGYKLEIITDNHVQKTIIQEDEEEKTVTIPIDRSQESVLPPKKRWTLRFSALDGRGRRIRLSIKNLTIKENSDLIWVANENGEYALEGVENAPESSTGTVWLPQVSFSSSKSYVATFNMVNPKPDQVQLYLLQKMNVNQIKETEITGSGRISLCMAGNGTIIPGLKAVSKGGSVPKVLISNFKILEYTPVLETDLNYWYDEDRDGQMEFFYGFSETRRSYWKDYGKYKTANGVPVKYEEFPEKIINLMPCSSNNDTSVDFCGRVSVSSSDDDNYKIYTNSEQGDTQESQIFSTWGTSRITKKRGEIFVPCDYNNDGITDFLLPDSKVAVRLPDGTYEIHQLEVLTQEEYRNRDKTDDQWSQNGGGGVVVQNRNDAFLSGNDMFIGGKGEYTGSMGYQASSIDFNKDGYPDIVNTGTGEILIYVAKDKYVGLPIGGAIYFRDLNNDQRLDYIVYEPTGKTVTAHVYQADGTEKEQKLISNLSMDQRVWCYDFDKDGDIDILLPFSYHYSNGAAYLVVMENDGKGKFKMHETSFDEELEFVACADIDHDGYYDVVAKYPESTASVAKDVLLLKGNNKRQFQLQPTPLIRLEENSGTSSSNREYEIQVADINNDGYYDIMAQYYSTENRGQMSRIYPVNDLLSNITANQAPQKPEKPTYLFEPSTGLLKVNWQLGKDAESSAVDLTYALRIGTEPGKGDIFYAHAMPDGTRLNLLDGNMGYSLDRILDASGWNAGKYYIAIQAIDPMHNGSAWSEEAVFEKTQLSSAFRITDERTVGDTLTLALTSPRDLSIEYKWDLAGANLISQSNNGAISRIQFTTPGQKNISLQTENAKGELSAIANESFYIFPNKLALDTLELTPKENAGTYGAIDLDGDGIMELLTGNGVHEYAGKNTYSKIKKIYNTNLSFYNSDELYITDMNKDGLPDIVYSAYKSDQNRTYLYHCTNEGDKTLSVETFENLDLYDLERYLDFNHDGNMDLVTLSSLLIGTGNDKDFVFYNDSEYAYYDVYFNIMVDLNKDGFFDNVHKDCENYTVETYICNNKGAYLEKLMPVTDTSHFTEEGSFTISAVADMNNDGYQDLIIQKNDQTILIALNDKNEAFNEVKEIVLPSELYHMEIGKVFDFDNNGFLDLALNSDMNASILYFYDNLETKMMNYGNNRYYYNGLGEYYTNIEIDLNRDGSPDFIDNGENSYFRNTTTATNTRPEAPANIRSTQTEDIVTLQWDAAKDVETPYSQMRYNISVKKQGATGEGAFIISPMNDLKADAAIAPNYMYQTATTYSIPLSALPTGTYEVQVQAIDGWNATSAFTEPYVLKIEANPQMQVPTAVCAGSATTVVYTGNASASGLTWNWDGGRLLYQYNNDKNYEVVWDTAGKKLISVTSDGVTSTAEIWVSPAINPEYSINSQALYATETPMTLPEGDYEFSWSVSQNGSEFKALSEYRVPPVRIVRNGNTNQAKVTFMSEGDFVLRLHVYTPCGGATCDRNIKVTDMLSGQEINLVTIDPATGKFNISWQYATELPAFVSNVNIYKEGNKYNDFHLLATVPVSQTSYVDITSNPQILASRYRLTLQTNYGAETTPGKPHQGVHAMVNKGAGNGWNITWSQYEGAIIETYRILRGSSPDNLAMIAEVSGNATSYSDLNAPAGTLYYALDFDAKYENNWKPMKAYDRSRANSIQVRSNIVSTEGAAQVIFAEDILVRSMEEPVLSPEQTSIHLTADVYPLNATFRAVNWTVISGSDIATVSSNGVLTAIGDKNGSITVRASAIDGSDVYAEMTIITDGLTSINAWEKKDNVLIYPSPVTDVLNIKNMPEANGSKNKIYIVNLNGQLMHAEETENTEASISCGSYATGVYLLKIVSEDKVTTRRFMKK